MADKKISQLSSASALTGAEPLAIVQDGVTKKTTVQDVANLSLLYPNGFKEVDSSRFLDSTDAGYVIVITTDSISLLMPEVSPFSDNQSFAIFTMADGVNFNTEFEGLETYTLGGETVNETIQFIHYDGLLYVMNTGRIYDYDDNKLKTTNKYFFDKINAL